VLWPHAIAQINRETMEEIPLRHILYGHKVTECTVVSSVSRKSADSIGESFPR
jgi:hypothetical protein